jgi:hypothetical protein
VTLQNPEVWTAAGIIGAALLSGIVGKVWRPMRQTVAAIDVLTGRDARYPGDPEERPGIIERLSAISAIRSDVDAVKTHVQNLETECPS